MSRAQSCWLRSRDSVPRTLGSHGGPSGRKSQADALRAEGCGTSGKGGTEGPSPDLASLASFAERGKTLVQKKPTMYPEWKSTFDAHIYEGRVIQIVLMRAAEEPMSEVTVGVSVLAERCKKNNGKAEFWVRGTELRLCTRVRVCVCVCVE